MFHSLQHLGLGLVFFFSVQAGAASLPPRYPGLKEPLKDIPGLVQNRLFSATGDCQHPESVQFKLLDSMFTQQIGDPDPGADPNVFIAPILRVSLFDDGSALLYYRELKTVKAADGTETSTWVFASAIQAQWVYSPTFPTQIQLNDLEGKGIFGLSVTDMTVDGKQVIATFPLGGIDRPVLKVFTPVLTLAITKDGPTLETAADYCRLK
jgi:hypothetical protein